MPIDEAHGRFTPAGQRLAVILRAFLKLARQKAIDAGRTGQPAPTFTPYLLDLFRRVYPELERHMAVGARTAAREAPPTVPPPPGGPTGGDAPRLVVDTSQAFTLFLPTVKPAAERMSTAFIREMAETTQEAVRKAIAEGLEAGEPLSRIQARLLGITAPTTVAERVAELSVFSPKRAATIARTEASRAMHAGQYEYGKSIGAAGIEWLASSDACPICLKLNGQKKRYGEPFYEWPKAPPEYRYVYFPPAHPNCVCAASDWYDE